MSMLITRSLARIKLEVLHDDRIRDSFVGGGLMQYLKITSAGEMSPHALTLMGATSKRNNDSKIGFFGTGNKYALACFMRNNIDIKIFSGESEISLSTQPVDMDGTNHNVIYVNGQPTSITTSMGPTWEAWQGVREIYSNAIDAGEQTKALASKLVGMKGQTTFYIEMTDAIKGIKDKWDNYFSDNRAIAESSMWGSILEGPGTGTVYRKGIRCIENGHKSVADYELPTIDIGEDRLVTGMYYLPTRIWGLIALSKNKSLIKAALANSTNSETLEGQGIDGLFTSLPNKYSQTFRDVVFETTLASRQFYDHMTAKERNESIFIHDDLLGSIIDNMGRDKVRLPESVSTTGGKTYKEVSPNKTMAMMTAKCLDTARACGINIDYPIIYAEFDNKKILAQADIDGKTIYLTPKLFDEGETIILSALLEEYIHIRHHVKDCTREMQNAVFNTLANVLIEQTKTDSAVAA